MSAVTSGKGLYFSLDLNFKVSFLWQRKLCLVEFELSYQSSLLL